MQVPPFRSNRIALTVIGIGLAFIIPIIFVVEVFFYIKIPVVFILGAFITAIAVGLIVPRLQYKHSVTPFILLITWFILMSFGLPLLTQPYYTTIAARNILPDFSMQLANVRYTPYEGFDIGGPHVIYSYRTTNQNQDYLNMKDLYKTKFSNKQKWNVFENSDKDQSYITFSQIGNSSSSVTLIINGKTPNLIEVGIDF